MEVFELIVDEKIMGWKRTHIKVEAESLEEAINMCIEEGSVAGECEESEFLYETEDVVKPTLADPHTLEIMDASYNILYCDDGSTC